MKNADNKLDALFNEKLKEYNIEPRAEAWQKLERRLAEKDKKIVPIWLKPSFAAALALLILSIGGYFGRQNNDLKSVQLAKNTSPKNTKTIVLPKQKIKNYVEMAHNNKVTANTKVLAKTKKRVYPSTENDRNEVIIIEKDVLVASQMADNSEILANKIEVTVENNAIELPTKTTIKPTEEEVTVIFTLANFDTQTEPILSADLPIEKSKKGYISKFIRQILNAKNGDKVNWREIGIKPNKIYARAENRLRNSKEEISNSYQKIKDKTVL